LIASNQICERILDGLSFHEDVLCLKVLFLLHILLGGPDDWKILLRDGSNTPGKLTGKNIFEKL
jgi:hypothetical protein